MVPLVSVAVPVSVPVVLVVEEPVLVPPSWVVEPSVVPDEVVYVAFVDVVSPSVHVPPALFVASSDSKGGMVPQAKNTTDAEPTNSSLQDDIGQIYHNGQLDPRSLGQVIGSELLVV